VRDRNPDTDGWWVINALLDEVRRGALLAIKGPRADLFPQVRSTPLTIFAARVDDSRSGEPMLFGRYDPRAQQSRLTAKRVAVSGDSCGGPLAFDAAVTVVGALAGNGSASTPLGDAQPFEYSEHMPTGDDMQTAWLPSKGGPPNQWLENTSGKKQWRLYDGNGNAAVDIDFGHDHGFGIPHSHNWGNGVRDNGNAFSLLPR
jgi:hypothetical protein